MERSSTYAAPFLNLPDNSFQNHLKISD